MKISVFFTPYCSGDVTVIIKCALASYSLEKAHTSCIVFTCCESELHLWLSISRWCLMAGLFSVNRPWGDFFFACHSCYAYPTYFLLKDSMPVLRSSAVSQWTTHTPITTPGKKVMKGCADRQRKQQLLLGLSSHTGGWRVEEGERWSLRHLFSRATSPDWSQQS